MSTTWATIMSECDSADQGYRQRIVSIFRTYEGQETDERDGSNRVIKVTAASFATHLGIHEDNFRSWVSPKDEAPLPLPLPLPSPLPRQTHKLIQFVAAERTVAEQATHHLSKADAHLSKADAIVVSANLTEQESKHIAAVVSTLMDRCRDFIDAVESPDWSALSA